LTERTVFSTDVKAAAPTPAEIEAMARQLSRHLKAVLRSLPRSPKGPTPIAKELGVSRVTVSKLLNALARESALETLQRMPGPESLRAITEGATRLGVDASRIGKAELSIDGFASLIAVHFGTRPALNAAISPNAGELLDQFELEGRYQIFKGMRQVLGVQAQTWLTSMIFAPSTEDAESVRVTTIHGALGMRPLRPDVHVQFTFGSPPRLGADETGLSHPEISLDAFCENRPARLRSQVIGGLLVHSLDHGVLGKGAAVDMLTVSHNIRGSRRYSALGKPRSGLALFVDVPVKRLVCDALVHKDLFPDPDPQVKVYKPGARGPANPNDPVRDIDRVEIRERIEELGTRADRFEVESVPNYRAMSEHVFESLGLNISDFRLYRLAMAYPIYGFQYVMSFAAPPVPSKS
jgi:hypothetical protein